jgi:hypothetical protein
MTSPIANSLARNYRIALAIVAALVLGNEVLLQPYITRLSTDAPLINIAGRQRMLSQRLAKAALAVDGGTGERGRAYLEEMKEVLGLWSTAHAQLLGGDVWMSRAGRQRDHVRDGLEGLEPYFAKMQTAPRGVIQAGETDPRWGQSPTMPRAASSSSAVNSRRFRTS